MTAIPRLIRCMLVSRFVTSAKGMIMNSTLASGLHSMPVVGDFIVRYLPIIIAVVVIAVVLIIVAVVRGRKKANDLPPQDPRGGGSVPPAGPVGGNRSAANPQATRDLGGSHSPQAPRGSQSAGSSSGGEYRGRHAK